MSCATSTIKYLVFIFNALCALLGIGTVVINAIALENVSHNGHMICTFLIVLGSIVFVVSFLGCCGAIRENICLTWLYAMFLLMLIGANAVILIGYIYHIDGESHARNDINQAWAMQLNGTDVYMTGIQTKLGCCGKTGSQDYLQANLTIPASCYMDGQVGNGTQIFPIGCLTKLIAIYEHVEQWVLIVSWTSFGVECVALIFACVLAITFRNQQRRSRY